MNEILIDHEIAERAQSQRESAIWDVLRRISFMNWRWRVRSSGDGHLVSAAFVDLHDGKEWTTRKWYVSPHATPSEIVQTMLKLVLTAVEHEAREMFLVDGRAIYGPHFSADALVALDQQPDSHDVRQ